MVCDSAAKLLLPAVTWTLEGEDCEACRPFEINVSEDCDTATSAIVHSKPSFDKMASPFSSEVPDSVGESSIVLHSLFSDDNGGAEDVGEFTLSNVFLCCSVLKVSE